MRSEGFSYISLVGSPPKSSDSSPRGPKSSDSSPRGAEGPKSSDGLKETEGPKGTKCSDGSSDETLKNMSNKSGKTRNGSRDKKRPKKRRKNHLKEA